jgi:hypothetical protein
MKWESVAHGKSFIVFISVLHCMTAGLTRTAALGTGFALNVIVCFAPQNPKVLLIYLL